MEVHLLVAQHNLQVWQALPLLHAAGCTQSSSLALKVMHICISIVVCARKGGKTHLF